MSTKTSTETVTHIKAVGQKPNERGNDFVPRGTKGASPVWTCLFLGLRLFDTVLQHSLLAYGIFGGLYSFLGLRTIEQPAASMFDLSPYRRMLFTMIAATCTKHFWYVFSVSEEAWHFEGALIAGLFNLFWNTIDTLLFLNAATSAAANGEDVTSTRFLIASAMFWIGISVETYGEMQRKAFKAKPENKGKCFTGGLFSVTRHINYSGYTLWRMGLALAHCGWIWAAFVGAFFVFDFSTRAIPALNAYCEKKYADQWQEYKRKTPRKLIPLLF